MTKSELMSTSSSLVVEEKLRRREMMIRFPENVVYVRQTSKDELSDSGMDGVVWLACDQNGERVVSADYKFDLYKALLEDEFVPLSVH